MQGVGKKLTLYFKSTADALINESVNDSNDFYQTFLETALLLRQMMAKTSNNLDDDAMNNIEQVNSIPIHLVILVTLTLPHQQQSFLRNKYDSHAIFFGRKLRQQ